MTPDPPDVKKPPTRWDYVGYGAGGGFVLGLLTGMFEAGVLLGIFGAGIGFVISLFVPTSPAK